VKIAAYFRAAALSRRSMSWRTVELAGGSRSAVNSGACFSCAAATDAIGRMWFSSSAFRSTRCLAVSPLPTRFDAA
jgi:hypothetical protein